jgi:uncharacterized protein (DUF1778 family)
MGGSRIRSESESEWASEDALLDPTVFSVSPTIHAEFLARLDAIPQPNEKLRRAMTSKAPWDEA